MCIKEADLNLDSNVIIFEGNNGQGKSAVMEAIAVCLSEHKRSDSVKEFVQKGFDHGKIILDLLLDGESLKFNVTLNYKGGTPLERDVTYKNKHYINSEVTDLIKELDLSFYSDIILSMQGQDDITTMTPVQRANLLQKLFQFDFTEQLKTVYSKIDECENNIKINKSKIEYVNKDLLSKKTKLSSLVVKQLPFTLSEFQQKQKEENDILSKINSINDALQKVSEFQTEKNSYLTLNIQNNIDLNNLINKKNIAKKSKDDLENFNFDSQLEDYNNKLNDIENKIKDAEQKYKDDDIEYDFLSKNKNDLISKKAALSYKEKNIIKKLELIDKGICPECGQSTHSLDKDSTLHIKSDNDEAIKNIESELLKIENDLNNKNNDLNNDNNNIIELKQERSKIETSILSLNNSKKQLELKLFSLDDWNKLENNIKETQNKIDDNNNKISELDKEIDKFSLKIKERDDINKLHSELSEQIKNYNEIVIYNSSIENQRKQYENDIKDAENSIAQININNASQNADIDCYNEVKKILEKELPNYLVVKTCAKLEMEMNDFVQIVFPQFKIRLLQSKRGVEFFYSVDPNVDMDNIKQLINAKMASGYERAVLGVAFKVALCKAYNLTFAAFDEIDAAASDENSVKTYESLIQSNTFEQMFFITHKEPTKETIKSMADNIISYHVTKGKFINDDIED